MVLGEYSLDQLPNGGEVGPVAFGVVIAQAYQKDEDDHTEDGTDKSAQQHRQVFANGVILPDKTVPLFKESHILLGIVVCSYYLALALATIRILPIL
jgi:hypothetical protein